MKDFNELPQAPSMLEKFRPGERAAYMAQAILDEIGQTPMFPPDKQQPTSVAKWTPSVFMPVHFQLQKFEHGASGKRYHFDVMARDGSPLSRYMIYKGGKKPGFIVQLDIEGKRIELDDAGQQAMHAKILGLLTNSIPKKADEIMGRLMNEEFSALMGRFIISDLAIEINGRVPEVSTGAALHAAEAHRQFYDSLMDMYGSPKSEGYVAGNDEDDSQTPSFEIAATRAAVAIAHKWPNPFDRNTPPERRIQRSS